MTITIPKAIHISKFAIGLGVVGAIGFVIFCVFVYAFLNTDWSK